MDQLPRLGKRELICLLLFTCNYVVSVWRGFLFLWVLGMGYVILLWHSLSLPYNYFANSILFANFCFMGTLKENMALQCSESGIRPTNDRHTSLCILQKIEMYIFKIALVISENEPIAFLGVLRILNLKANWFTGTLNHNQNKKIKANCFAAHVKGYTQSLQHKLRNKFKQ